MKKIFLVVLLLLTACGEQEPQKKPSENGRVVPAMTIDLSVPGNTPMTEATYGKQVEVLRFKLIQHNVSQVTDTNGFQVDPWIPEISFDLQYRALAVTGCTVASVDDGSKGYERQIKEIYPPTHEGDKNEERALWFHPNQPQFPKDTVLEMSLKCDTEKDGVTFDSQRYLYINVREVVVGIAKVELNGAAFSSLKFK